MRYGKLEPEEKELLRTTVKAVYERVTNKHLPFDGIKVGDHGDTSLKVVISTCEKDHFDIEVECPWDETKKDIFRVKVIMLESANRPEEVGEE